MPPSGRFPSSHVAVAATLMCRMLVAGSCLPGTAAPADEPIRVVVWDERQPEQKQAYPDFLGNRIAEELGRRDGIEVRSVGLDDAAQGLAPEIIGFAEVMVWWSHKRNGDIKPEPVRAIVDKVRASRLVFVAIHSAHWAPPFTALMDERAREDVGRRFADVPVDRLQITEVPAVRKIPAPDAMRTPAISADRKPDGSVAVRLHLPLCVFPKWRSDGQPSLVTVLDPAHPLAADLPGSFTLDRTEMYAEPFHVPEPDAVVCEESWESGERFRSVMVWRVGEGRVVYIRPGHETYPIWTDGRMLRLLENTVRWSRSRTP